MWRSFPGNTGITGESSSLCVHAISESRNRKIFYFNGHDEYNSEKRNGFLPSTIGTAFLSEESRIHITFGFTVISYEKRERKTCRKRLTRYKIEYKKDK